MQTASNKNRIRSRSKLETSVSSLKTRSLTDPQWWQSSTQTLSLWKGNVCVPTTFTQLPEENGTCRGHGGPSKHRNLLLGTLLFTKGCHSGLIHIIWSDLLLVRQMCKPLLYGQWQKKQVRGCPDTDNKHSNAVVRNVPSQHAGFWLRWLCVKFACSSCSLWLHSEKICTLC